MPGIIFDLVCFLSLFLLSTTNLVGHVLGTSRSLKHITSLSIKCIYSTCESRVVSAFSELFIYYCYFFLSVQSFGSNFFPLCCFFVLLSFCLFHVNFHFVFYSLSIVFCFVFLRYPIFLCIWVADKVNKEKHNRFT